MWLGWFIICLSLYWEVRFAILEHSVVVLSSLYHWLNFVLKSPSAITKNGFGSKIYLELVLSCLWMLQYIPANRKCQVFLMVMNFYNRYRRFLVCYWLGGLPELGHPGISKFLSSGSIP